MCEYALTQIHYRLKNSYVAITNKKVINKNVSQTQYQTLIVPALKRLGKENLKLKSILGYRGSSRSALHRESQSQKKGFWCSAVVGCLLSLNTVLGLILHTSCVPRLCLAWVCAGLVHATTVSMSSYEFLLCLENAVFLESSSASCTLSLDSFHLIFLIDQ